MSTVSVLHPRLRVTWEAAVMVQINGPINAQVHQ